MDTIATVKDSGENDGLVATANTKPPEVGYTEEMRALLQRAQDGDPAVVAELHQFLNDHPEVWRQFGDMAAHARDALPTLASRKSVLAHECIRRRMEELQADLAGPTPSVLEKLLVERIAICWLQTYLADLDALQKDRVDSLQASHAQRRVSTAQARYLAAIKQLAVVRKLLKPSPTTLDLLRKPVDETSSTAGKTSSRFMPSREPALTS
jgi:hypothetical protein